MSDYISREALLSAASGYDWIEGLKTVLKRIPAADVRPVVRAAWRGIGKTGRIFVCSACDKTFPYKTRCCPNCGAWMEES